MTNPSTSSLNTAEFVVRPVGEVDWGTVSLLRGAFERALVDAADGTLLVDLSEVTFMDGAALTVLLQARRDWGNRLRLFRPPASLRLILRALEMDDVFTIVDSLAPAQRERWPSSRDPRRS